MVAIQSGWWRSILPALITGVVVPVLLNAFSDAGTRRDGLPATLLAQVSSYLRLTSDPEERVTAQGMGSSAEEAWYEAVRAALRMVVSGLVDAQTWARDGRLICTSVLGDCRGLVTHCQDLGCRWDRDGVRREVAVFVDRAALVARLRAARVRVVGEVAR